MEKQQGCKGVATHRTVATARRPVLLRQTFHRPRSRGLTDLISLLCVNAKGLLERGLTPLYPMPPSQSRLDREGTVEALSPRDRR